MVGKSRWTWLLLVLCTALLCGCSIDSHLKEIPAIKVKDPLATDDEEDFIGLVLTYFALPEGESTLVRLPGGKRLLIDTGSAADWPVLYQKLLERKVTRLDYVVLTNDQPEYAGGYPYLLEKLEIDTLIMPKLIETAIRKGVPVPPGNKQLAVVENDELKLDEGVAIQVLMPNEPLFLSPQNNSLVFRLQHDKLRFLFTSGINEKAEERLLERHPEQLKAEVLKVGDQGSNQGSSQPFLTKVDPHVAIISTGQTLDNLKESQEVLERLGESWAETYITSQDGTITILSNGNDYRVLKEKQ
jgi:competence protein ComEC